MPLYDYHCPHCRTAFEQLVSYHKADEVTCPSCGHAYARRHLSKIAARKNSEGSSWSDRSCATNTSSAGG
ncbi:MAG: hypothetical protein NVSMB38_39900 [Ktedonobacteraceae bacterium]